MVVDDEVVGAADVVVALADVDGTVDDSVVVVVTVLDVVAATSAAVDLTVIAPLGVAAEDGPHAASPISAIDENETPNRHRLTPSVNP